MTHFEINGHKVKPGLQLIGYVGAGHCLAGSASERRYLQDIGWSAEMIERERPKGCKTYLTVTEVDGDTVWFRPKTEGAAYPVYRWPIDEARELLQVGWAEAVWWSRATPVGGPR